MPHNLEELYGINPATVRVDKAWTDDRGWVKAVEADAWNGASPFVPGQFYPLSYCMRDLATIGHIPSVETFSNVRPGLSVRGIQITEIYGYLRQHNLRAQTLYGTTDRLTAVLGPAVFCDERTGELTTRADDSLLWVLPLHGGPWTSQERAALEEGEQRLERALTLFT